MRTVTETFEVYTFNELDEKAKNRVREYYGESCEAWIFSENCKEYINNSILPNSRLSVHFDLSYCQGDFLSIYGELSLSDVLDKISDTFSDKDIKYLRWLINEWCRTITIRERYSYGSYGSVYFTRSKVDFADDVIYDMEYNEIRGIRRVLINSFEEEVYVYLDKLCDTLKESGYSFFYEYEDEEVEEWCDGNEYEFYADGMLYA